MVSESLICRLSRVHRLTLTPLELAAEDLEESAARVQQFDVVFRFAAADSVAIKGGHSGLAIDAQISLFVSGHDHDFNLRCVAYHKRAMGQRMSRYGRDDEALDVWHQNGASCCK